MRLLTLFALAATIGLTASSVRADDDDWDFRVGPRGIFIGPDRQTGFDYDGYGRRLNRYNNSYGWDRDDRYRNRHHRYRYPQYDHYGRNRGWMNDYRNYYRTNPYSGYNRWYPSRPGISFGNGRSGFYFSF